MTPNLGSTLACALLAAATAAASGPFVDPAGDSTPRPTDAGADGPIMSPAQLPDVVGLEVTGWLPNDPLLDPYTGSVDTSDHPDLLRLALVFQGLVNPPGPLGHAGLPYDPGRFGPRPFYGFVEFDLDRNRDSGGEENGVATNRFLANAARFGSIPSGIEGSRLATTPGDIDQSFGTSPRFERTGAEFVLAMCGCWDLAVIDEGGTPDGVFDTGDTWLVEGRFLERAQGFDCLSLMYGNAADGGPSAFGLYDPVTEARISHDSQTDQTTLEIVFPLTPAGAAMLTGEAEQPIDFTFGGGNHFSLEEALVDLKIGAQTATGICGIFADEWNHVDLHPDDDDGDVRPLDPTTWRVKALIGTAYEAAQPDATYVWTDIAFGDVFGDVTGDGEVDALDVAGIDAEIAAHDGSGDDADGQIDGRWTYAGFGPQFSLYDLDYDGVVGPEDAALVAVCPVDLAEPFGILDLADINAFVVGFTTADPIADLNGDGLFDLSDITTFVSVFMQGCGP